MNLKNNNINTTTFILKTNETTALIVLDLYRGEIVFVKYLDHYKLGINPKSPFVYGWSSKFISLDDHIKYENIIDNELKKFYSVYFKNYNNFPGVYEETDFSNDNIMTLVFKVLDEGEIYGIPNWENDRLQNFLLERILLVPSEKYINSQNGMRDLNFNPITSKISDETIEWNIIPFHFRTEFRKIATSIIGTMKNKNFLKTEIDLTKYIELY